MLLFFFGLTIFFLALFLTMGNLQIRFENFSKQSEQKIKTKTATVKVGILLGETVKLRRNPCARKRCVTPSKIVAKIPNGYERERVGTKVEARYQGNCQRRAKRTLKRNFEY